MAENPEDYPTPEDLQRELQDAQEESQFNKQQRLQAQTALESGYAPKPDANIIEYKLSSEEYLERLEHYLRGDVLHTSRNEDNQIESYWALPRKKITVLVLKETSTKFYYLINEFGGKMKDEWVVQFVQDETRNQTPIAEEYGKFLGEKLKEKLKKKQVVKETYATVDITDEDRTNLSEWGVQEVMGLLSTYINKETTLSYYKEDRIREIVWGQFGRAINKFVYLNSDKMGLNTEFKKTKFETIVLAMIHAIENTYRRSLNGMENRGTREGIVITQSERRGDSGMPNQIPSQRKFNPFRHSNY